MKTLLTYGHTEALDYGIEYLKEKGFRIAINFNDKPDAVLLPVPSLDAQGNIPGGDSFKRFLKSIPTNIPVIGGKLDHPFFRDLKTVDLLQEETYLWGNAVITAHCAVKTACRHLPVILPGLPVLVIGWGRIGKVLAQLLSRMGAKVTVASRKSNHAAEIHGLGYEAISSEHIRPRPYRVIFNTAPAPVLTLPPDSRCLAIDLASVQGIYGDHVIWARGLPNRDAPESSGQLIAEAVVRYFQKEGAL